MKVVFIGDSIRGGYQPFVMKKCSEWDIWGPSVNCRHSIWVLDHFQQWVAEQAPDIVHVNFGIHDASIQPDGEHQILLCQYRLCLQRFVDKIKELKKTRMIWATTTPLYIPDEQKTMVEWELNEAANIKSYNASALKIVQHSGIPVNDLHEVVISNDFTKCISKDGIHMTEFGNEVLSNAVIKAIKELA